MVMRYGMSERLGPRVFGHDHSQPFLGREFSSEPDYSDEIAREIDDEIRRVVEAAHQRARDILTENRASLDTISEILVRRETIEKSEFEALAAGAAEEDVFPEDVTPQIPPPAPAEKPSAKAPRTLPRPGLAGGSVEARALDAPEKPSL
ncbi:MAG TPA: cell division protein FtsH, partial [Solirubrobacteraceae bacterium]|nr:cell division protein FtsH [Solirubrobacteraceae bacterium]